MILEKRSPRLRGWFPVTDQIVTHAGFADIDAQFEQFAMNARRAPEWVLTTLLAIGNTSVRQEFAIYFGLRLPFHVPGFGVSSGQYPDGSSRHRFPHNPAITSHSAAPTFKSGWKIKRFSPAD